MAAAHARSLSVDSLCSLLSCTSQDFKEFYETDRLDTDELSRDVLTVILRDPIHGALVAASTKYRLDRLLESMLEHAPSPFGKRYVAIALHIGCPKGSQAVIDVAQSWMKHLFIPMLALSIKDSKIKVEPSSSLTPTLNTTAKEIEPTPRSGTFRNDIRLRENYRCAITGAFDKARVKELVKANRDDEIPPIRQEDMEAAHIIPYSLNNFVDSGQELLDSARTWDMLKSWTCIDITQLVGEKINTTQNGIYLTSNEHDDFGRFRSYFDKNAYPDAPNKYRVEMLARGFRLGNGERSAVVEFPTQDISGFEPPSPEFLKIHAAFAKVLHLSGAAEYVEKLLRGGGKGVPLRMDPADDFTTRLGVAILAH